MQRFRQAVRAYRAFWLINPGYILLAGLALGIPPFVFAMNNEDVGSVSLILYQAKENAEQQIRSFHITERNQLRNYLAAFQDDDVASTRLAERTKFPADTATLLENSVYLINYGDTPSDCVHDPDELCKVFLVKSVGYMPALNWSVVLAFLFPITLFFAFRAPRLFQQAISRIHERGMFYVTRRGGRRPPSLRQLRGEVWRLALLIGVPTFILAATTVMLDWRQVVHQPFACLDPSLASALACEGQPQPPHQSRFANELDWSIAATFTASYDEHYNLGAPEFKNLDSSKTDPISLIASRLNEGEGNPRDLAPSPLTKNYFFSLYVYAVLAVFTGLLLAFYGYLLALALVLERYSRGEGLAVVMPDLLSSDPRRGFQHFWPPLRAVLVATFIAYIMLYLMRIQNLFLREQSYTNIFAFMFDDILNPLRDFVSLVHLAFSGQVGELIGGQTSAVSTASDLANVLDPGLRDPQAYFAVGVLFIGTVVIAILVLIALHDVAARSRDEAIALLDEPASAGSLVDHFKAVASRRSQRGQSKAGEGEAPSVELEKLRANALTMDTWPLKWPGLGSALRLLAVGILFMIFYRAMLIWLGLSVLALIRGLGVRRSS